MKHFKTKVIAGQSRGRRIGFPTANLDKTNLDIDYGVYLVKVEVNDRLHKGLLHFGPRKTFNEGVSLELYIKDFDANIYHQEVKIKIIKKIREVKKFKNIEELKKQISRDLKWFEDSILKNDNGKHKFKTIREFRRKNG